MSSANQTTPTPGTEPVELNKQAARRRTFAIISHPDAGKTTLTEKLLLYANAIHLAGSVKSKRTARHTVSDWMAMERERGISISSSVLQFEHHGRALNLLDTPGHADFSEDTYRVLSAVDSALMLIDHAKGIEARTLKLFEVCRMRKLPVLTFMNKLDRWGKSSLELLDEVSKTLDLKVTPLNWPVGQGPEFRGIVDLKHRDLVLYESSRHGEEIIAQRRVPLAEAEKEIGTTLYNQVCEDLDLLSAAGDAYDQEAFLRGELSPVFWGSAMTNFGIEPILEFLAQNASPPRARRTEEGEDIEPSTNRFTGFIFKIQANMNPRHRDRIAFLRVVSGHFARGMDATIGRNDEVLRLAKPHSFMAAERSIVDDAWPGDIVGLYDPGKLRVGDSLSEGKTVKFAGIPRFAPEHFARLTLKDPLKRKQLDTGLEQLAFEGVIQMFYRTGQGRQDPVLGAVGLLQFEVLLARLKDEYNVTAILDPSAYRHARWVGGTPEALAWLKARRDYALLEDRNGRPVLLVETPYSLNYALENAKGLELFDVEPL